MKRLAVQDANVLIDLWGIGLLDAVFSLELEMHTTDFVLAEILDREQRQAIDELITENRLKIHTFDTQALQELVAFYGQQGQLSLEDCSVWKLAETQRAILLTTDGALRRKARAAGLEVHGSLWLLDELLAAGVIDKAKACQALRALLDINPRLPKPACQERVKLWCGGKSR